MSHTATQVKDTQPQLTYRTRRASSTRPTSLLFLLHGVGGSEIDMASLASVVSSETLIVMPRGPVRLNVGQFGWFGVTFTANGPQIVATEAEDSRITLIEFIKQTQSAYEIGPNRTTIAGFSQGGIMSASVALSAPELVSGFAVLAGRILPELEPMLAPPSDLAHLSGLIVHGEADTTIPVSWAGRAHDLLTRLGVSHEYRIHPDGHVLSPSMTTDFIAWLEQ